MQNIKETLKTIFLNPFVKTPLIALVLMVVVISLFFAFLHIYSRHGQGFPVPDFSGLKIEKAKELAKQKKLRIEVTDSVYIITKEPGTVVEQNPTHETYVKANRRIFVTTNAVNPILVEMPDLVGLTLRQAKSRLFLQGFKIDRLSFISDIAVNNVLEQHYDGDEIEPGTEIPKGAEIKLVLGKGLRNEKTVLPRVIGLTYAEARNLLLEASLNLGRYTYDATVIDNVDSLQARVYSQYPNPNGETLINFGANVDLWLTQNESRIPPDPEIKEIEKDSILINHESEEEILE
ncbi:MAG: PASTA domain-containing protein [Bacteroidales bacterium]